MRKKKQVRFVCQECGTEAEIEVEATEERPWPIVPHRCDCGGLVAPEYEDEEDEDID